MIFSFPMKRLVLGLVVIPLLLLSNNISWAEDLLAIRIGQHPEKTRFVLELSEAPAYRVFTLPDPYRVVIDLPKLNWKVPQSDVPKPTGVVEALRFGLFEPEVSRLVLDAKHPVAISSVFLLPPKEGHRHRLVVDMIRVTDADYKASGEQQKQRASNPPLGSNTVVASKPPVPDLSAPTSPKKDKGRKIIVIDAGHGGVDPGATGVTGILEKTLALEYAQSLRDALEKSGRYSVVMTRDNDTTLALRQRVGIAQDANGDLFISLHANKHPSGTVKGISVYSLSENGSDKEAEALAAKENKADIIIGFDLSDQSPDVSKILIDLAQRETNNQGKQFANVLVGELKRETVLLGRPHRSAGFAVLKSPVIPSVLIELGYMSNREEEKILKSSKHRQKLVGAITRAVDEYFGKLETFNSQ
ncbi:N-acetylmuramoyl-L-alanine amidase [Kiloniella laminariae]|uniref:N-acetylmuramoyl-L-alanine amidase n=1 Tax=Kiloniella laminariae TaxID=454162 RepID=A0ABT4LEB1_9PROT|nr:N-acetylmuramoyl-L-alanine amidase [Kiloniella laminariae]MCZ4279434.1 N-acetylmuramoyl-L-alanine amidase [Kiloniella laminariae]